MLSVAALSMAAVSEAALITLNPGDSVDAGFSAPAPGEAACSTCAAQATFALSADGTKFTVSLTNTSTDGLFGTNIITALGLDTTPDLVLEATKKGPPPNVSSILLSDAFATGWEVATKGASLNYELIPNTTNGVNGGLDGGQKGTVQFIFTSPFPTLAIDASRIHIQQLADGGGTKFDCCDDPEEPVPEPGTLLLLGGGLLLAGERLRRRRQQR